MKWLLALPGVALCMSACAESTPSESTPDQTPAEIPREPVTAVYRCKSPGDEIVLVTRTRDNGLHVFLPPAVPGGHLDCEHDRRASIWEHAKLNGVSFRAVGNEPGWVLEIRDGDRLDLNYDYGQSTLSVAIDETHAETGARTTTYSGSGEGRTLTVRLVGEACGDTMSDETFPTRVEIQLNERKLSGCGRPLH